MESSKGAIERFLETTARDVGQIPGWNKLAALCRRTGDLRCVANSLLQICEIPGVGLAAISNAANTLNSIIGSPELNLDWTEKRAIVIRIIFAMKPYVNDVDATDCSRLAWLHLRIGNLESARKLTQQGLALDPSNEFCLRLVQRLFG